jgi:glutamate/tyrosine decarboxylase-like PLP-dependent enzyme
MSLPERGLPLAEIVEALQAKRARDVRWEDGRTFGMVYDGGPEVRAVAHAAAEMYLHENALNTLAFPSLGEIQSEVVAATAALFHAPEGAAGFMTSGGTESILMAVKAARERARAERSVSEPNMVIASSAHAAFHKAGHYFGIEVRKVDVDEDWHADVDAMAARTDNDTILVVGSAPQYPQGVIDPIPEIAAVAGSVGASMHVDACMGGFVLPFTTASRRSRPTSTNSAMRRREHRCSCTARRRCAGTRHSYSMTGSAGSTRRPICKALVPVCRWRPRGQ